MIIENAKLKDSAGVEDLYPDKNLVVGRTHAEMMPEELLKFLVTVENVKVGKEYFGVTPQEFNNTAYYTEQVSSYRLSRFFFSGTLASGLSKYKEVFKKENLVARHNTKLIASINRSVTSDTKSIWDVRMENGKSTCNFCGLLPITFGRSATFNNYNAAFAYLLHLKDLKGVEIVTYV